ncbi:MAG: 2-hydroxyacid dehydrogenase [Desulfococcaceae bacterium]
MSATVVVSQPIPQAGLQLLRERFSAVRVMEKGDREGLKAALADADALLPLLTDPVNAELMDAGPKLQIIANCAVGYDNIDLEAAAKRGIPVTNTPGVLTRATAEIAFALLISMTRRILEADRFTRAGKFTGWDPLLLLGDELAGRTIGVFGMGRIGRDFAKKCRAFDMRVIYHNRNPVSRDIEAELDARLVSFQTLLAESDAVSIHAPLTEETRHRFDDDAFSHIPEGAYLINTARGELVDEAALVRALQSGRLKGAGLDVYEFEPKVSPELLEMENVVLLPHIGSATEETRGAMASTAARNIIAVLDGKPPLNLVPELRGRV